LRTLEEVSADKLRGGFYSPDSLVKFCLDRAQRRLGGASNLRVLEPSAGDGAFIRGLRSHPLAPLVSELVAVEVLPSEAHQCREQLHEAPFNGRVLAESFIPWTQKSTSEFDMAVGNPPFVRFQFVGLETKQEIAGLADRLGVLAPDPPGRACQSSRWRGVCVHRSRRIVYRHCSKVGPRVVASKRARCPV
jgi:hypothetical protein